MQDNEIDLKQFIELFDKVITSNNPTVKKAFKNLLMVTILSDNETAVSSGPLAALLKKIEVLEQRITVVESLKTTQQWNASTSPTWIAPTPYYPTTTSPTITDLSTMSTITLTGLGTSLP